MFAALIVVRLREAAAEAGVSNVTSWKSPDDVPAVETPLAKAAEKVLASMQAVLGKTYEAYREAVPKIEAESERAGRGESEDALKGEETKKHLKKTKAAEVRVVRNVQDLINPPDVDKYRAQSLEVEFEEAPSPQPDAHGLVHLGGKTADGAVQISQ
jgi:pyridoxine kinase